MNTNDRKAIIGIMISLLLVALSFIIPVHGELTRTGYMSLALFFSAVVMWICNSLPMCITAFLIMFMMPLFGIMELNQVFTSFGGTSFFFAIATFVMSAALENTSIPLRICYGLTKLANGNSTRLTIALLFAAALTSGIMSNLSTTIIFLSLARGLLHANNCQPGKSNLGRCLMIGIPAMAGCGGLITPAGTPGNLLILQLLESASVKLSFLQWVLIFAPLALLCCLVTGITLTKIYKPENVSEAALETLKTTLMESGKMNFMEKKTIFIIVTMLICWILGTWIPAMNITIVAVIGMSIMFFPGIHIVDWDQVKNKINWNLCFTIGSVGVLISGMTSTGIMNVLVNNIFSRISSLNVFVMFFVIAIIVCIIRAFIPTAPAIVALFGPPLLSLVALTNATPTSFLVIPAFWACTPLLLWIEPIFLFSYGDGYYKPGELLKAGCIPSLIMCVVLAFVPMYLKLFGL